MKSKSNKLDYKKLFRFLSDKYHPEKIYIFIGYIKDTTSLYANLTKYGYKLIFKVTLQKRNGEIKGNVDAELVVQALKDFYEINYDQAILISGDGDFSCLIKFWKEKTINIRILAPNKRSTSYLLRKENVSITYLDDPDILKFIKKDPR